MALPYSKYQGEGGGPTGTTAYSVYIVLYFFVEFFERQKPELNKSKRSLSLQLLFLFEAEVTSSTEIWYVLM
jgi:hypothetical protein